jgi:ABC-type lipoprotein export system ATPase subunit
MSKPPTLTVTVDGPSGGGKSSLLSLIAHTLRLSGIRCEFKDVKLEEQEKQRPVAPGDRLRSAEVKVVLVKKASRSQHLQRCNAAMKKQNK